MLSRTARSASAIFAAILASMLLTTASRSEPAAPDNCLTAPKADAPPHSHWFYRIEHGTKRHCWYLRGVSDQLSQAAPQNIVPPAKMTAPQPDVPVQRPLADARAEIPAKTDRSDAPNSDLSSLMAPWSVRRSNAPGPNGASTVVAARWPEPFAANRSGAPQPATVNMSSADPPAPIASAAPADAAVAPADDNSPSQGERGILPILVALTGALTLAGLIISKFGRARGSRPRKFRARRGPLSELTDDDRIVLSDDPGAYDLPRRSAFPQTVRSRSSRVVRRGDPFTRRAGHARS
jgi:hypothetical protein